MKTLVITGASKGIGFATAKKFCDGGYRVINFSRSTPPDERIESYAVDLSDPNIESRITALLDEHVESEEICLVHNSATMLNDTVRNSDAAKFVQALRVNLVAPQMLNRHLINKMQPGSSIIYLGSTLSEKAVANTFSYVTSKHAVVGMMRATCQDLSATGIHTSCICPGFTDTEMLRTHVGDDEAVLKSIASSSTFGRLIEPDEIATAIYYAAQNPVINGAVIHANLGQIES